MCEARLSCQMLRFSPFGGWIPILWDSCEVSAQSPSEVTSVEPGKSVLPVIPGSVYIVFVTVTFRSLSAASAMCWFSSQCSSLQPPHTPALGSRHGFPLGSPLGSGIGCSVVPLCLKGAGVASTGT